MHHYTYEDYVGLEMYSDTKHEYLDGEIYAMAGGSEEHSALAAAMVHALFTAVAGQPCRAHTSDLRIYVESVGLATFPDASVICGALQQHEASPKATALNPTILVEVTSDSSEEYDRGAKLEYYRTIPTLREYLIVSHRERRITLHARPASGAWETRSFGVGEQVHLPSLGAGFLLDEIYRDSSVR